MVDTEVAWHTRRFEWRGAAKALYNCRDGEILLSGPAGTGKSRACQEKLNAQANKYPGMRGLIVRKTLASLGSTTLVTWRTHVINDQLKLGHVWFYGGSQEEAPQYRYANGSSVTIGGLDKPTKIMSSEYDVIYVGEAIELDLNDWEACTTRLRNGKMPYQQLYADTNPDRETHWLNQRCLSGATTRFESRHTDNPIYANRDGSFTELGRTYVEGTLGKLTGVRKLRLKDGLWVSAEGVVYEGWDPALHVVGRFDVNPAWSRYWTVDFGYTNPFVLQCWAEDPDGRLYLYREIYHTRRLVEDHARAILDIVAPLNSQGGREWLEPKPRAIYCDHDAEGRATLEKHLGLGTTPANKKVKDGIQAVEARLKPAGDGMPRLFVLRQSVVERDQELVNVGKPSSTEEEFTGYVWDRTNGKSPKEEPLKQDDHGMDATRYMVVAKDVTGQAGFRWM